ncbi:MAG: hypothetical protein ABJB61_07570 [bacterium]|jgi:hypothetical protein
MAKDPNEFARSVLDQVIAKHDPEASREQGKHPRAVALGLKGGAKGGHIRAQNLSPQKRRSIAQKAAKARWAKRKVKKS